MSSSILIEGQAIPTKNLWFIKKTKQKGRRKGIEKIKKLKKAGFNQHCFVSGAGKFTNKSWEVSCVSSSRSVGAREGIR